MNTDNNTPTPSEIPAQSGQAVSGKNHSKKYNVYLSLREESRVLVVIEATTLEEARDKANEIFTDEVDDWNYIHSEVFVNSVQHIAGGKANE